MSESAETAGGQKPKGAVEVFVFGIVGLLLCQILGIVAWVKGNDYMRRCREASVEPEGLAVTGRILGIIASVVLILAVIFWVFMAPTIRS